MVYCSNCGIERHYPTEAHSRDDGHICCNCIGCANENGKCKLWIEQNPTTILTPTSKAPAIDLFLSTLSRQSRELVIADRVCMFCKDSEGNSKPIGEFRDRLSEQEYTISGMCQSCQASTFNVDGLGE